MHQMFFLSREQILFFNKRCASSKIHTTDFFTSVQKPLKCFLEKNKNEADGVKKFFFCIFSKIFNFVLSALSRIAEILRHKDKSNS